MKRIIFIFFLTFYFHSYSEKREFILNKVELQQNIKDAINKYTLSYYPEFDDIILCVYFYKTNNNLIGFTVEVKDKSSFTYSSFYSSFYSTYDYIGDKIILILSDELTEKFTNSRRSDKNKQLKWLVDVPLFSSFDEIDEWMYVIWNDTIYFRGAITW